MAQDVTGQQSLICARVSARVGDGVWFGQRADAHLPHQGAGGVFFTLALPVPPPEAVGGGKGLGLHDLRVINVTGALPMGRQVGGHQEGIRSANLSMSNACLKFSIR